MLVLNNIHLGDNLEFTMSLPDNSVDAIITDSPYGLGKEPDPAKLIADWLEKGYHEVKGTGFMGKKWDAFVPQPILWKECYRVLKPGGHLLSFFGTRTYDWGTLAIRLAGFEIRDCIQWIYGNGFPKSKSQLKPANEPICVARKPGPLTIINVDECRIDTHWESDGNYRPNGKKPSQTVNVYGEDTRTEHWHQTKGRYPSNVIFDEVAATVVDEQSGVSSGGNRNHKLPGTKKSSVGATGLNSSITPSYNDTGGASRFFYVAKASPSERKNNPHPTVKPIKLISQLVKLYVPQGGLVLDPHMGSGTLPVACIETEWCNYLAVDNDPFSFEIAQNRISKVTSGKVFGKRLHVANISI